MHYGTLLLPELELELANTRTALARVPDGQNGFRPHRKSYSLSELAGHLAEMPMFVQLALTDPDIDLAKSGYVPLLMESKKQVLYAYDASANKLLEFVKSLPDKVFEQDCELLWDGHVVFAGTRYNAYRTLGLNHLVRHRAQLGAYLRLLELPIARTAYRPSADES